MLLAAAATELPSLVWVLPFVGILGCIAVLPLIPATHHWWEENRNKLLVSAVLGAPVLWFLLSGGHGGHLHHALVEYVQFIILLGSLYYISGGIVLRGDLKATPGVNCTFLGIGALIASFIGTTGASMLLIRPLLKTNSERKKVVHTVVFFIFTVSNIGGCLTPLGDPPLFLGFLRGVPFEWTFGLWKPWLFMNVLLLFIYWVWDSWAYRQEDQSSLEKDNSQAQPLSLAGSFNFLLLGGVIVAVAGSQWMHDNLSLQFFMPANVEDPQAYISHHPEYFSGSPWREMLMIVMVLLSGFLTSKALREENKFTFGPIGEVAALFIGIFITMVPALMILKFKGPTLGVDTQTEFFWFTGILSSFLDNAPTYLTFFELAKTMDPGSFELIAGVGEHFLIAISLGAVFMGANTYIGNGPNFMVKAVAEETGVKMPSFFGYMVYSALILVPLFVVVNFIFLS